MKKINILIEVVEGFITTNYLSRLATTSGRKMIQMRIYLTIPKDMIDYAKLHGALYDNSLKVWFYDADVPFELASFVMKIYMPKRFDDEL